MDACFTTDQNCLFRGRAGPPVSTQVAHERGAKELRLCQAARPIACLIQEQLRNSGVRHARPGRVCVCAVLTRSQVVPVDPRSFAGLLVAGTTSLGCDSTLRTGARTLNFVSNDKVPAAIFLETHRQEQIGLMTSVLPFSRTTWWQLRSSNEQDGAFSLFEMRKWHTKTYPITTGRLFDLQSATNIASRRSYVRCFTLRSRK